MMGKTFPEHQQDPIRTRNPSAGRLPPIRPLRGRNSPSLTRGSALAQPLQDLGALASGSGNAYTGDDISHEQILPTDDFDARPDRAHATEVASLRDNPPKCSVAEV